ncbi:eukaryotic translation initiation factor 5B-like isoform X5 [Fundulus heteroclitus]|uniref:eukaryotic translation initiation factor 5B-like isoform X5 n=1 Tax=Fundulus heteroclitus TaxID=8078 RepID=UPI00165AE606|nr:eukaryotic translation initiation factor 5B-like isoform X5 [Fundulus heteroclitus]
MKSSKPTIEKETWGDIVERELGVPPEGIIIYPYEGEDDFDDFDSYDRGSEKNSYPPERTCENSKEKDYSDNHTSECIKDVSFSASEQQTPTDQRVSRENVKRQGVSKECDHEASLEKQSYSKETLISTPPLVPEKQTIPETQETQDQQEKKQPFEYLSNKTIIVPLDNWFESESESESESKTQMVQTPYILFDPSFNQLSAIYPPGYFDYYEKKAQKAASKKGKKKEVIEEVKVSETLQNGDEQKPSKKPKRKKKQKTSLETASGPETLKDQEVSGENTGQEEVSTPEIVKDQSVSLQNEICTNETVISKPQEVVEEVKVSETLQNGDEQGEKKPSKKSKRKKKQKTSLETASGPETLKDQEVSGENTEQEEVSTPEIVKDQSVSLQNEICTNEMVISKPQEVVEEVKVSETLQNGDEQGEKKPSKKSKRKKKQKTSLETASGPETLKDQEVSGENTQQEEVSTPEIVKDQSVSLQNEICTNETVISKPQEVVEEVKVSETLQNGDEQGEKKPSKKSKRKKKQKTSLETASGPETLKDQEVSGENTEQEEVSTPEIVKDQSVSLQNEICTNETVMSKPQEVVEEVKVSETLQNGDEQGEKKPSKKSKRKKKQKTSLETASGPETLKDQEVSGENTEQEEVSTPEIVKDQSVSLQNEICTNETVISKPQEVVEEVKVSETLQNGDEQGEKKPSKKSKRKNKQKTSLETASGPETLKDQEVSGENTEQVEVSTPEIVKDQSVSLQNEICIIEKVISKAQEVVEEVKVSQTLQNGDEQGEKKPSKKSKRKKKQKTSLETASGPETLKDQEVSGENTEQEEVSTPEIVKDQSVSLQNEICTNETVISKPQEVVEEVKVSETLQNGDEQGEKKPSKKSKKSVFSLSVSAKRESGQKEKQTSKALKVSEREKASKFQKKSIQKEKETKSKKSRDAVTSPPQMEIKEVEDAIHTQAAEEGLVQDNNPKQADSIVKKVSLWKRIKKAMTPSNWCRCTGRKENQPQ